MHHDALAPVTELHHDGTIMMQRTQIMLDPEDHRGAKRRAAEAGISLAEYIRRLVRADLEEAPKADVSVLFGLGDSGGSGGSDIANHKDQYIGEAVEAEHIRDLAKR